MICLLALAALAALGMGSAAAEDDEPVAKPPVYVGGMAFPSIWASEGPEQYFWEVQLQTEQELVQIDDRHAEVLHESGHRAFLITAEQAHDATGAEVPTSFEIIAPNLLALTVHHRGGNPAAAEAPFQYPVIAGPPYTVGFSTVTIIMPSGEPAPSVGQCVTPRLTGNALAIARERLAKRGCALGAVRGTRGKGARVVKQFRDPGTVLAAGARVAVKLG